MRADPDITIYADQTLPDTAIRWEDETGEPHDFTAGWTFHAEMIDGAGVIRSTKTSGFILGDGAGDTEAPNVVILWAIPDLTGLAGPYSLRVVATRDADGKRRIFRPNNLPTVLVRAVPAAPAP